MRLILVSRITAAVLVLACCCTSAYGYIPGPFFPAACAADIVVVATCSKVVGSVAYFKDVSVIKGSLSKENALSLPSRGEFSDKLEPSTTYVLLLNKDGSAYSENIGCGVTNSLRVLKGFACGYYDLRETHGAVDSPEIRRTDSSTTYRFVDGGYVVEQVPLSQLVHEILTLCEKTK